jgi:uncharacterized membrane protein YuzA (DUF378 family)
MPARNHAAADSKVINMTQTAKRFMQAIVMVGGLLVLVFGILATYDLWHMPRERFLPASLQGIMFLGPFLIALGTVVLLCRLPMVTSSIFRRAILALGLLMLVVGGFPWIYTPCLTGGRPGNEGAGMLGTMIFIFVGLPGIATTLSGLVLITRKQSKDKAGDQAGR